ncbi:MAG: hypothetical protein RL112_434 [Planctomycetota bacterium]
MTQKSAPATSEPQASPSMAVLVAATEDARLARILDALAAELALPLVVGKGPAHLARALDPHDDHLLVLDWRQAGAGALEVAEWLARDRYRLPHVAVVAPGSVPMSVQALRNGACEAVELALPDPATGDGPDEIVERSARTRIGAAFSLESHLRLAAVRDRLQLADLRRRHAGLREIERTTLLSMVAGTLNKQVAQELRIAERTVKKHRATVLRQMGAANLADLVRMAIRLGIA